MTSQPGVIRPATWRGLDVPPVLLSGDHAKVAAWRREQSLQRTAVLIESQKIDLALGGHEAPMWNPAQRVEQTVDFHRQRH